MKKILFSLLFIFCLGGGLWYASAGPYQEKYGVFHLSSSRLERVGGAESPFFVPPNALPSFSLTKGEKTTETLNICRINLSNPGKWANVGISHLDTTDPEEINRWVAHNAEYFPAHPFTDVSWFTAQQSIATLYSMGVVKGYTDGTFRPYNNLSRSEFLKIAIESTPSAKEAMAKDSGLSGCFSDTKGDWSEGYVCFAKKNGYVKGKSDGSFHPLDSVSYGEALKMLYRIKGDIDAKEGVGDDWFGPFLRDAQEKGIALDDVWDSGNALTRAQMSELVFRYMKTKTPDSISVPPLPDAEEAKKKIATLSVPKSQFSAADCAEMVTVSVPMSANATTVFDLNTVKEKFQNLSGLFAVYIDDTEEMQLSTRYFAVMNAGVLLKKSAENTFVWAFDMATGAPLKNAKVYGRVIPEGDSFWNASGDGRWGLPYFASPGYEKYALKKTAVTYFSSASPQTVLLGTTNDQGFLQVSASSLLMNKKQVDPSLYLVEGTNTWGAHLENWKWDMNPNWFPDQWDTSWWDTQVVGHIYTDRTMYRPGHTVNFKGVIFQKDQKLMGLQNLPEGLSVTIKLTSYESPDDIVAQTTVKTSKNSSFSGSFTIPENASLGTFQISVSAPAGYDKNYTSWNSISNEVRIEEYRRPTFYLTLNPEKHEYFSGETAVIKAISARYAGGIPEGVTLSYRVTARPVYESDLQGETDGFQMEGMCNDYCEYGYFEVTSGKTPLDANGNGKISIPLQFGSEVQTNLVLIVEGTVRDNRGEEASELTSFMTYSQSSEDYARPAFKVANTIVKTGENFDISLQSKNYQLKTVGPKDLWTKLEKITLHCTDVQDLTRGTRKDCEEKRERVEEQKLVTGANGTLSYRPKAATPGKYIFTVSGGEKFLTYTPPPVQWSSSEMYRDSTEYLAPFTLTETLWSVPAVPEAGHDTDEGLNHSVELALGKETYHEGEKATLLIHSPFKAAKGIITIEGNKVFSSKVIDITGNYFSYEFPVTHEMTPNIRISAFIVETGTSTPRFKIGYENVVLSMTDRKLLVTVSPQKEEYKTGEDVVFLVKTTDDKGRGVPAEVSLAVVDEALVRMAGQVDTNFALRLFPYRWITLTSSTNLLAFLHDHYFSSFGGAGKGGVNKNMPEVRKDFKEVLYWNPTVQTDANGSATVSFPAGEALTSYIALGAGFSTNGSSRFGSGEGTFVVKKDFVLQPDLPRFVREGDALSLTTRIVNLTSSRQSVTLSVKADPLVLSKSETSVTLDAGATQTVSFPVTVPEKLAGKTVTVTFSAVGSDGSVGDAIELTFPIETHGMRTTAQRNTLLLSGTENIVFEGILPENFEALSMTLTNSSLVDLKERALKLLEYPYGCAEQTTSTTMPNAIVAALQKEVGEDPKSAEKNIMAGFARLKNYQESDGGFSLWGSGETSSPSVSATVGGGLAFMKASGYAPPSEMTSAFSQYLRAQLSQNTEISRPVKIRLLYVGTLLGAFSETQAKSYLTAWYEKWGTLTGFEKTDLALAMAKVPTLLTDEQKRKVVDDVLAISSFEDAVKGIGNIESPHYFDGADSFSARQVRVAIALDPTRANLSDLVQKALKGDSGTYYYFSSYSEAERLLMMYEYAMKTQKKGDGNVSLSFGGKTESLLFTSSTAVSKKFSFTPQTASLTPITLSNTGNGPIYISSQITFRTSPEKLSQSFGGISVKREILDESGKVIPVGTALSAGKVYQVRVSFSGPVGSKSLAISSPLPAGFEVLTDYKDGQNYSYQHIELRDNRVDLFPYDWQNNGSYTFKVRALSKGTFSLPPTTGVAMYDPKVFASTEGAKITIQ